MKKDGGGTGGPKGLGEWGSSGGEAACWETDKKLQAHIGDLLKRTGEDPSREGLQRTPERFLRAFRFVTQGYTQDIQKLLNGALFENEGEEMVTVKNIEFYSLCEHHLLPFFGKAHVGYLPNGKIVGLSKIPRILNAFARRLQVQERLTHQVAECLMQVLKPHGVAVVIEAHHMCMMMRGVEKQGASTLTSALHGDFRKPETRAEFFHLIR